MSLCHVFDSSAALSEENKARCHRTLSFGFSIHRVIFMIVSLSLQPTHTVYPAAPSFCSYQYSAARTATGHSDAHYAAVSPGYRNAEATAPHHGPGRGGGKPLGCCQASFVYMWLDKIKFGKRVMG